MKILLFATTIAWMAIMTESATVECDWSGGPCSFVSLSPVNQQNEAITVNGQPSTFVEQTVNVAINIYSTSLKYYPTQLHNIYPNIISIGLKDFGTMTLVTDSIIKCNTLETIQIQTGTILNLPDGFAQTCSKIRTLTIRDLGIETIEPNAFKGLTSLELLDMGYNKVSCLHSTLFQNTPSIQTINLGSNKITGLDRNLFKNLPRFTQADFMFNAIQLLPDFDFTGTATSNSFSIVLSSNPINAIKSELCSSFSARPANSNDNIHLLMIQCFEGGPGLYTISASSCQNSLSSFQNCFSNWTSSMSSSVSCMGPPTTLPPTTISDLITTPSPTPGSCPSDKVCRYFLDQYNRYTCILDGVDSVLTSISGNHLITFVDSNVHRVIFTNSFLSRIPPILFQKFTSLEYLTVSNCSMSAINTNTFTACGSLKYFDASDDFITTVDGASFKSCAALEVIDLTGNKFDMISGQLFVNNPTLKAVYINRPPAMVLV